LTIEVIDRMIVDIIPRTILLDALDSNEKVSIGEEDRISYFRKEEVELGVSTYRRVVFYEDIGWSGRGGTSCLDESAFNVGCSLFWL
jgi:hypothetical protein